MGKRTTVHGHEVFEMTKIGTEKNGVFVPINAVVKRMKESKEYNLMTKGKKNLVKNPPLHWDTESRFLRGNLLKSPVLH